MFFLSGYCGSCYVLLAIVSSIILCLRLLPSLNGVVFSAATMFSSFQEYFLHKYELHSQIDWTGKEIHQNFGAESRKIACITIWFLTTIIMPFRSPRLTNCFKPIRMYDKCSNRKQKDDQMLNCIYRQLSITII
jgi:hypothetical protein